MKSLLIKYKQYNYILKALGILLIITLTSYIFRGSLAIINITLIHIIPVIVVAIHGNIKATLFMTLLSVIFLNFLYIPPLYSFSSKFKYSNFITVSFHLLLVLTIKPKSIKNIIINVIINMKFFTLLLCIYIPNKIKVYSSRTI